MLVKTVLILPMLMAATVGGMISVQGSANAYLAKTLGHPLWATSVSLLVSTVLMLPLLYFSKVPAPHFQTALCEPWWMWLGGFMGALGLTLTAILVPKLGAATYIVLVIVGQIAVSMLLDHFGLLGLEPKPVNLYKLGGVILLLGGIWMIHLGNMSD